MCGVPCPRRSPQPCPRGGRLYIAALVTRSRGHAVPTAEAPAVSCPRRSPHNIDRLHWTGTKQFPRSNVGMAPAVIAAVVAYVLLGCSFAWADEPAPLLWGADADGGAPYVFRDPERPAEVIGFEVDLAAALAAELNRPLTFKQYSYKDLLPGLDRRDFDIAINGLEVTPERARDFRLSRPYYVYKLQLVTRADDTRFKNLDDCKAAGAVVGTLAETAAEQLLNKQGIAVRSYDDQVGPYLDLEGKRIDAVLMDVPIAAYYALPNSKLKYVGDPIAEGRYAIALRKDQEVLALQIDEAISKLAERGDLRRIYEKWHIWNDDQKHLSERDPGLSSASGQRIKFVDYMPRLIKGAGMTVLISVCSMALAVVLGLIIAATRMYGPAPLRWLAVGYIEFFRGVPILLVLYFLYFGLPALSRYYDLPVSLNLWPLAVAILGFGMTYAAYEAEIYRAGINAVPRGQWEAAASLGMTPLATFRRIVLPQAVRTILPPMTNDFVALFKDTSLVSIIAVNELTKEYQTLTKTSLQYLELGLATAALYLIMSVPLGYLSHYLERRWSQGER